MEKYNGVEVVASALVVKDDKVLLVKSPRWKEDNWIVPGGHVDLGETVEEAVIREGEEETGLRLKPLYCVNVGELIFDPSFNRKAHLVYFHYVCEVVGGEIKVDPTEVSEVRWFTTEEALDAKLNHRTKKTVENYVKGIKFDIESRRF